MKILRACSLLLGCFVLCLTAACSGYNQKWNASSSADKSDCFAGRWEGEWKSDQSGHQGRLQCVFSKVDPTHYRADFQAYWNLLHGTYSPVFATTAHGNTLHLQGTHDLGALYGGVYHYEGVVTAGHFEARYVSKADHGTFDLHRAR